MLLSISKSQCAKLFAKRACFINGPSRPIIQERLLNISCQVEPLVKRGLIRVSGEDASSFLQGIVTNDMKHLHENKSIYTMFLNTKGRVLFDSIVYKRKEEHTFFVECDLDGVQGLVKHLKMYRVRRKVNVDPINDEWKLWVLFNPREVDTSNNVVKQENQDLVSSSLPSIEVQSYLNDIILSNNSSIYPDPRLTFLGYRVIAPENENVIKSVQNVGISVESSAHSYRMFRYRLGVGEGIKELPTEKCFPLEANCDYLRGVSFHKGCYIGQELTARTHHTGVVRKRLMPLVLDKELTEDSTVVDASIEDASGEKKTSIGKLRGVEKNCALGLMRIAEALVVKKLKINSSEGATERPHWWPQELPKERMENNSRKG